MVLITTKKGQEGNLTLDYNASFGSQQIANTQRFMTGQEYTETLNGIIEEGDLNPNVYHPVDGENHNTDWQGLLLGMRAFRPTIFPLVAVTLPPNTISQVGILTKMG